MRHHLFAAKQSPHCRACALKKHADRRRELIQYVAGEISGLGIAYVMIPDQNGIEVRYDLEYVGQQVGGFNANELAPPIPEPQSWALLMAGLAMLGMVVRCRARG